MALPSQMPRSGQAPARVMGGGRRAGWKARRRRRIVGVVALAIAGGLAFIFWPDRVSDAQANGAPSGEAAAQQETAMMPVGLGRGADPISEASRRSQTQPPAPGSSTGTPGTPGNPGRSPAPVPVPGSTQENTAAQNPAATSEPVRTTSTPTTTTRENSGNVIEMGTTRSNTAAVPAQRPAEQSAPVRETIVSSDSAGALSNAARAAVTRAEELLARNRPVEARDVLNRMLHDRNATSNDRAEMRARLAQIAQDLTFSARVVPEDTTATTYTIASGDSLARIIARENFDTDFRMLQRLNNITDPGRIRPGQRIKALKGPFHVVVHKGAFRMDLYADQTDSAGNRIFLRSFAVGIGELDSETPLGAFRVRQNSKLIDPRWVNPRTGEVFASKDPKNPIGNRWIGIEGIDAQTESLSGYGIHGTIEPHSIGARGSMGCIRMLQADVELIYDMLVPLKSTVLIVE